MTEGKSLKGSRDFFVHREGMLERRNRELCPRGVIEAHVLPTIAPPGAPGPRQLRSREPAGSDLQQNQVKGVVAKLLAVWGDNELL